MKKASLVSIGTELLIGQTIDTNSAWIGQQLNQLGVWLSSKFTVGDRATDICKALDYARQEADYIFVTGGLGPTSDDITKEVIADYVGEKEFVTDQPSLQRIRHFFAVRGKTMDRIHETQALLPKNATPIPNEIGTAAGMWFDVEGKQIIVMPGVPAEMKHMFAHHIMDKLRSAQSQQVIHNVVLTYGKGESEVAAMLSDFEKKLPSGISLAYLPHQQLIRLRLTSVHPLAEASSRLGIVEQLHQEMVAILQHFVVAQEDISLAEVLAKALLRSQKTMATAESCTGGSLAHHMTRISGASAYYKGSIICYANEIKHRFLGVSTECLERSGAVSEEVVSQMATCIREQFGTDYGIALSGIMGPNGETADKPVGLVYMAVAEQGKVHVQKRTFRYDRIRNIEETTHTAIVFLLRVMEGKVPLNRLS